MTNPLKLKIDFRNATFEGEGEPEDVNKAYDSFREKLEAYLTKHSVKPTKPAPDDEDDDDLEGATTVAEAISRRKNRRPRKSAAASSSSVGQYAPALDKDLDIAGLSDFYRPWAPRSHAEKILIFAKFLEDVRSIKPCTADQIFTCYCAVKEKIPEAYVQALRDASGSRNGYIAYNSPTDISVSIMGLNHFAHGGLRRKASE
ncbi:MAG: hypothetical protein JNJ73_00735 [Hyphomonadaceae bacterium]|nr:hypothetical protein [Hyphomonadaceae bacterium]